MARTPPVITFDPEPHTYTVNGSAAPSVTQILDDLIPGWHADDWYLQRGNAVHACAAMIGQGQEFDNDPTIDGQVSACRRWFADVKPEVLAVEKAVASVLSMYAGTLDLLARVTGKLAVLDYKASVGPSAVFQLAAYANALKESGIARPRFGATIELRADGSYRMSELHRLETPTREFLAMRCAYGVRQRLGITGG